MILVLSLNLIADMMLVASSEKLANQLSLESKLVEINSLAEIQFCSDKFEANFLFIQLPNFNSRNLFKVFKACKELRIPYVLYHSKFQQINFRRLLMPVHFLVEEKGKAQYASTLSRFCGTEITILQANDYGSRAETHTIQIVDMLSKLNVELKILKGKKDSFKIDREAVKMSVNSYDCIILSASRDFALDDVIFGPPEVKNTKISPVPIIWVNPRGDLYALCD